MEGDITHTLVETIPPAEHRDIHDSIKYMASHPRKGPKLVIDIQEALDKIDDKRTLLDEQGKEHGGDKDTKETVLHTAVKCLQFKTEEEKRVVEMLIQKFPQLILCDRPSTKYEGQTPLHMAVCKGNIWLVTVMLQQLSAHDSEGWKSTVLKRRACGSTFSSTVMLGELPLSIAALTFNKETGSGTGNATATFVSTPVKGTRVMLQIGRKSQITDMIDLLLDEGAELDGTNSVGDNVCHSLIRYGQLYPDKKENVLDICRKLVEDHEIFDARNKHLRKMRKKILLMENRDGLNALQLSVKLGFHEMFEFIMEQEPYCRTNSNDGLFDIKVYDVTEMDIISFLEESDNQRDNNQTNSDQQPNLKTQTNPDQRPNLKTRTNPDQQLNLKTKTNPGQQPNLKNKKLDRSLTNANQQPTVRTFDRSILMMMFDIDPDVAFQFIKFPPFRLVVNRKWNAYRKWFYPFWLFHFVFICFLTWYSVERSRQVTNSQAGYDFQMAPEYVWHVGESPFVTAFGIITVLVGITLVGQELYRFAKGRMPWSIKSLMNPYDCGFFRIMFLVLGVGLIVDFFLTLFLTWYENYLLIISVILGWFLNIFFIRALKPFSFFTILIQNVILGDMFRFFVIIGFELVAFATAMYMAIQGSDFADDPNYSNIWRVLFSMFTLIVGLGDVPDFYQTRQPFLSVVIFIGFVVMTTLLMINGLIAIMSRTCTELVENVGNMKASDRHSKLQRLSVILFLESIFKKSQIKIAGQPEYVPRYHNASNVKRYMLELRSLQSEDENDNDDRSATTSFGLRTMVSALIHQQRWANKRPSSGISDRMRYFFKRKDTRMKDNSPGQLDIYHINRCESCNEHKAIHD